MLPTIVNFGDRCYGLSNLKPCCKCQKSSCGFFTRVDRNILSWRYHHLDPASKAYHGGGMADAPWRPKATPIDFIPYPYAIVKLF